MFLNGTLSQMMVMITEAVSARGRCEHAPYNTVIADQGFLTTTAPAVLRKTSGSAPRPSIGSILWNSAIPPKASAVSRDSVRSHALGLMGCGIEIIARNLAI